MEYTVENLEGSKAKLTITVDKEAFNKAREKAFQRNKNRLSVPGFRKGKVPRKMIEKMYGKGIFDDDAVNFAAPDAYKEASEDTDLEIISHPEYDIVEITEDDTFIFTATVAIKPEVKLGDYKGLEVTKRTVEVTDEDVDAELDRVREQNSRMIDVTDRPVKDGDTAKIDFDGYIDNEPFEGGKGEDYNLLIGSHSFIDDFEEQLIGANIGDEVEVKVNFPDDYHEESLQGKPAVFHVNIKAITEKELPELDDEFAEEVSEFDTLKEYKEDIKKHLTEKREEEAANAKEAEAVEKLVEIAEMDLADEAVNEQIQQMVQEFRYRLQMQGVKMEQYMQMTGMTPDILMGQMRPEAERRLKTRLALEAVVKAENLEADDEAYEEEVKRMASMYGEDPEEYKKNLTEKEDKIIRMDVTVEKAAKLVAELAKEVEKPAEEETKEDNEEE